MSRFKRGGARYSRTPEPQTPYQRAAQAWDERIGSARIQARNWRLMAFAAMLLAGGSTGALVWTAARGQITPWVVQVDRLGRAEAVAPAVSGYRPADPEIAAQLAQFISDVRSVPADPVVLRQDWLSAYAYASGTGAQALGQWARDADPFARVGREEVAVDVSSVVRASPSSFRVEWVERHYADGALQGQSRWTAILTVRLSPPHDPDALRRNPLGIFVTAFSWSKELA